MWMKKGCDYYYKGPVGDYEIAEAQRIYGCCHFGACMHYCWVKFGDRQQTWNVYQCAKGCTLMQKMRCGKGWYADLSDQTDFDKVKCKAAASGSYVDKVDQDFALWPKKCPKGTHQPAAGAGFCSECPPGKAAANLVWLALNNSFKVPFKKTILSSSSANMTLVDTALNADAKRNC